MYTIGDMAKKMNVATSTLRYYDKEGLLPFVGRSEGGIRIFTEADFSGLSIIHCLKQSGLSIKEIKQFIDMCGKGDETINERLNLFKKKRKDVENQIRELQKTLEVLDYKCWFYEKAQQDGTTELVENMTLEELPERYAVVQNKLNSL